MEKIKQNQEIDVRYLQSFEKGHQYNQNTNSKRFSENFQRYVFVLSPPKSLSNVKIHQSSWSKWHIVKRVGQNLKNNTVCHPSRPLLKHTLPHSKNDFFELLQLTLISFVHSHYIITQMRFWWYQHFYYNEKRQRSETDFCTVKWEIENAKKHNLNSYSKAAS